MLYYTKVFLKRITWLLLRALRGSHCSSTLSIEPFLLFHEAASRIRNVSRTEIPRLFVSYSLRAFSSSIIQMGLFLRQSFVIDVNKSAGFKPIIRCSIVIHRGKILLIYDKCLRILLNSVRGIMWRSNVSSGSIWHSASVCKVIVSVRSNSK